MTELRKAAEMALECLDYHWDNPDSDLEDTPYVLKAKQALRQALAQPVDNVYMSEERVQKTKKSIHEPVAWMKPSSLVSPYKHGSYQIPLYTAPPKREWNCKHCGETNE